MKQLHWSQLDTKNAHPFFKGKEVYADESVLPFFQNLINNIDFFDKNINESHDTYSKYKSEYLHIGICIMDYNNGFFKIYVDKYFEGFSIRYDIKDFYLSKEAAPKLYEFIKYEKETDDCNLIEEFYEQTIIQITENIDIYDYERY